jgi:hypothetical protein
VFVIAAILAILAVTPAFAAPIQISKAVFVSQADGFGNYTKEKDNHFLSGSSTSVYVEVENFTVPRGDEDFRIDIRVELDVMNSEGNIIAKSDKVFSLKRTLKSNQRDLSFKVPLDFSKWKTGKYTLVFKATDNIQNMLHIKKLPLEIF